MDMAVCVIVRGALGIASTPNAMDGTMWSLKTVRKDSAFTVKKLLLGTLCLM